MDRDQARDTDDQTVGEHLPRERNPSNSEDRRDIPGGPRRPGGGVGGTGGSGGTPPIACTGVELFIKRTPGAKVFATLVHQIRHSDDSAARLKTEPNFVRDILESENQQPEVLDEFLQLAGSGHPGALEALVLIAGDRFTLDTIHAMSVKSKN